jgi:DNA-directed DNA polymerase III PolC
VEDAVLAETLAYLFPRDRLWLELATPGRTPDTWEHNVRVARNLGAGAVATGDIWFGAPEDWSLHRTLRAVAGRTLVTRAGTADGVAHPSSFLATPAQMARRLGGHSWALCQAASLAEDCNLSLETGKHLFPSCSLGLGETPRSRLAAMCGDGMRTRFGASPHARVRRRLETELDVIDKLGFCAYFIVVGEIVEWARRRGISALGRGSGASSLVAYLLGITGVDPLRYGLCFERFLNSSRPDYPDLDIDLCWRRRDEVIQHVYDTYGDDRVAMISTHVTFRRRSALREMAKAWGLVPEDVSKAVRSLGLDESPPSSGDAYGQMSAAGDPNVPVRPVGAHEDGLPGAETRQGKTLRGRHSMGRAEVRATRAPAPEPLRTVLRMAHRIHGFPRHLGIHCGGIVIAPGPLRNIVPLERASKGVVVTQYEMNAVERIGLVKMDLLGNRGLTVAQDCIELANAHGESLGLEDIPDADPAAAELLAKGDTLGCFQIESPAMRQLLAMVGPRNSDEVIASVALVRPGPAGSGMKDAFVRRKRGLEKASFAHPCVTPVLSATHGVMLYEEDVLKVAAVAAGISLEDGDDLRRAISEAKGEAEVNRVRRGFLDLVERRGIPKHKADTLWNDLARFSSYAFCKAHAAGYGLLAYRSAYLKAHYPAEFAVAVLNNHAGMYPTRVHLEDARRRNVEIRGPCVNRSAKGFIAEGNAVRVGLSRLKGMRAVAVREILEARQESCFKSLADLLARVSLTAPEAEALVLGGAIDLTGVPRPNLLLEVLAWGKSRGKMSLARQPLLDGFDGTPRIPGIGEFDPQLRLEMEGRYLGLTPTGHPVQGVGATRGGACSEEESYPGADSSALARERPSPNPSLEIVACVALRHRLGRKATVLGVVSASRRIRTEAGEPMLFLTIEDATGLVETVVFPGVYRAVVDTLEERGPLVVTGRVEDHYGALTLVAEDITPAARRSRLPAGLRGRGAKAVEGQAGRGGWEPVGQDPDDAESEDSGGRPGRAESDSAEGLPKNPEREFTEERLGGAKSGLCERESRLGRTEVIEGCCLGGHAGWPNGGG